MNNIEPHTLLYNQNFETVDLAISSFLKRSCAQAVDFSEPQTLLEDLSTSLFGGGYGDKLQSFMLQVNPSFQGSISYQGFEHLTLEGDFGEEFSQLAFWSYNVML